MCLSFQASYRVRDRQIGPYRPLRQAQHFAHAPTPPRHRAQLRPPPLVLSLLTLRVMKSDMVIAWISSWSLGFDELYIGEKYGPKFCFSMYFNSKNIQKEQRLISNSKKYKCSSQVKAFQITDNKSKRKNWIFKIMSKTCRRCLNSYIIIGQKVLLYH